MLRSGRESDHRGGDVLLFVKNEMHQVEVKMESKFTDQVWCKIKINNGEDLLIGVCYRSPNMVLFSTDNDKLLRDMILEIRGRPLLLMGDFNYPDIDWPISLGLTRASQHFVDCIEDVFLTQHVMHPTRGNSILDLVFTSEPDMVDTVSVLGSLGSSDHNILYWTVHISRAVSLFDRPFLDCHKCDYSAIRQALSAVDWTNVLQGDANNQWTTNTKRSRV